MAGVGSWLKNFGKSVGYSSMNVLTNLAPNTENIVNDTKDEIESFKDFVSDFKAKSASENNALNKTSGMKDVKDILKSTLNDVKTGNFSIPKQMDIEEMLGFDTDFDSDNLDDTATSTVSSAPLISNDAKAAAKATIASTSAINGVIRDATILNQKSQIKTAKAMIRNTNNMTLLMTNRLGGLMGETNKRLGQINDNIVQIARFMDKNQAVVNTAQLKFMDEASKYMQSRGYGTAGSGSKPSSKKGFFNNGFSVSDYKEMVKKNIADNPMMMEATNMQMMASMGMDIAGSFGGIKNMILPSEMALTALMGAIIPKNIQKSIRKFDEAVPNTILSGLGRLSDMRDTGGIVGSLADIFAPNSKRVGRLSLKTDKNPISWDGKSKRALEDVIPHYLSLIEANTRSMHNVNDDQNLYDYDTGTYKSYSKTMSKFRDKTSDIIKNSSKENMNFITQSVSDENGDLKYRFDNAKQDKMRDILSKWTVACVFKDGTKNLSLEAATKGLIKDIAQFKLSAMEQSEFVVNFHASVLKARENLNNMRISSNEREVFSNRDTDVNGYVNLTSDLYGSISDSTASEKVERDKYALAQKKAAKLKTDVKNIGDKISSKIKQKAGNATSTTSSAVADDSIDRNFQFDDIGELFSIAANRGVGSTKGIMKASASIDSITENLMNLVSGNTDIGEFSDIIKNIKSAYSSNMSDGLTINMVKYIMLKNGYHPNAYTFVVFGDNTDDTAKFRSASLNKDTQYRGYPKVINPDNVVYDETDKSWHIRMGSEKDYVTKQPIVVSPIPDKPSENITEAKAKTTKLPMTTKEFDKEDKNTASADIKAAKKAAAETSSQIKVSTTAKVDTKAKGVSRNRSSRKSKAIRLTTNSSDDAAAATAGVNSAVPTIAYEDNKSSDSGANTISHKESSNSINTSIANSMYTNGHDHKEVESAAAKDMASTVDALQKKLPKEEAGEMSKIRRKNAISKALKYGIVGAILSPNGPIGGAAIGAGIGVLSSMVDFKSILFGKKNVDKDGVVHIEKDGLLNQWGNMFSVTIREQAKISVTSMIEENKAYFHKIMDPIGADFSALNSSTNRRVKSILDAVQDAGSNAINLMMHPVTALNNLLVKLTAQLTTSAIKTAVGMTKMGVNFGIKAASIPISLGGKLVNYAKTGALKDNFIALFDKDTRAAKKQRIERNISNIATGRRLINQFDSNYKKRLSGNGKTQLQEDREAINAQTKNPFERARLMRQKKTEYYNSVMGEDNIKAFGDVQGNYARKFMAKRNGKQAYADARQKEKFKQKGQNLRLKYAAKDNYAYTELSEEQFKKQYNKLKPYYKDDELFKKIKTAEDFENWKINPTRFKKMKSKEDADNAEKAHIEKYQNNVVTLMKSLLCVATNGAYDPTGSTSDDTDPKDTIAKAKSYAIKTDEEKKEAQLKAAEDARNNQADATKKQNADHINDEENKDTAFTEDGQPVSHENEDSTKDYDQSLFGKLFDFASGGNGMSGLLKNIVSIAGVAAAGAFLISKPGKVILKAINNGIKNWFTKGISDTVNKLNPFSEENSDVTVNNDAAINDNYLGQSKNSDGTITYDVSSTNAGNTLLADAGKMGIQAMVNPKGFASGVKFATSAVTGVGKASKAAAGFAFNHSKTGKLINAAYKGITKNETSKPTEAVAAMAKGASNKVIEIGKKLVEAWTKFTQTKTFQKIASSKAGQFASKVGDFLSKFAKKLATKASGFKEFIDQQYQKIAKILSSKAVKTALIVGTIAWDGISGALDAANLFYVKEEDVDGTMRVVSVLLKGFCDLAPFVGPALDMLSTIGDAIGGKDWDLKYNFAGIIYNTLYDIMGKDKLGEATLTQKQDAFEADYQQYLKDNNLTEDDVSIEQYNDIANQTLGSKIVNATVGNVKKAGSAIATFVKDRTNSIANDIKGSAVTDTKNIMTIEEAQNIALQHTYGADYKSGLSAKTETSDMLKTMIDMLKTSIMSISSNNTFKKYIGADKVSSFASMVNGIIDTIYGKIKAKKSVIQNIVKNGYNRFNSIINDSKSTSNISTTSTFSIGRNMLLPENIFYLPSNKCTSDMKTTSQILTVLVRSINIADSVLDTLQLAGLAVDSSDLNYDIKYTLANAICDWLINGDSKASQKKATIQTAEDENLANYEKYLKNNKLKESDMSYAEYNRKIANGTIFSKAVEGIKNLFKVNTETSANSESKSVTSNYVAGNSSANTSSSSASSYAASSGSSDASSTDIGHGAPMSQLNPKYANETIGRLTNGKKATMANSGCGPTALANAAGALGIRANPGEVGKYAQNNKMLTNGGANSALFTKGSRKYGMNGTPINGVDQLYKSLDNGNPVIMSGNSLGRGGSLYSKEGHIISISGRGPNGTLRVDDGYGHERLMNPSDVLNGSTSAFSMSKLGGANPDVVRDNNQGKVSYSNQSSAKLQDNGSTIQHGAYYYSQNGQPWSSSLLKGFNNSPIGKYGCVLTSAAMGASSLLNTPIDPGTFNANYGNGTISNTKWPSGVTVKRTTDMNSVMDALANRQPVMLYGVKNKSNIYYDGGTEGQNHCVLATGLDSNGNIIINNPWSTAQPTYAQKTYPASATNKLNWAQIMSKDGKGITAISAPSSTYAAEAQDSSGQSNTNTLSTSSNSNKNSDVDSNSSNVVDYMSNIFGATTNALSNITSDLFTSAVSGKDYNEVRNARLSQVIDTYDSDSDGSDAELGHGCDDNKSDYSNMWNNYQTSGASLGRGSLDDISNSTYGDQFDRMIDLLAAIRDNTSDGLSVSGSESLGNGKSLDNSNTISNKKNKISLTEKANKAKTNTLSKLGALSSLSNEDDSTRKNLRSIYERVATY